MIILPVGNNYAPVDNHYPKDPNRKCFPTSGQTLTPKDTGKIFTRCFPYKTCNLYDWSYVPKNSENIQTLVFQGFFKDKLVFQKKPGKAVEFPSKYNDGNWILKDRFLELIKS